ncbi:L-arabinose-responsive transcription regulator ARA1 [Hyphodiscus hymeniophilus]|uniref:L-arabinose-responsive transcription regulator ARA1 n=1 Tax=Hyphodiscus hymeniophilus TaxID=353542 RepID=A0A9P7AXB2_9HELO|nr:L-arabinose-responsive transcription regulator ARA1 [Hyphodiscus hymeniophilus]
MPGKQPQKRQRGGLEQAVYTGEYPVPETCALADNITKKKCNENRPICDRCTERGLECEYEAVKPRKRRRISFAGYALSHRTHDTDSPTYSPTYYEDQWHSQYEQTDTRGNENETDQKWETRSEYQYSADEAPLEWEGSFGNDVEEIVREPLNSATSGSLVRSRSQYPDLAMIAPSPVGSPLLEFSTPNFMEFTEKKNRRALVDHFCNVLSHLIVFKEDTGNPFRQLVLPLSHSSLPVMNAIFALSSAHLEGRGIENEEKSLDFHNKALQGLAQLIDQNEQTKREEMLGAIMLLVYYEVLVQRGSSNIVTGHLKGAMTILRSGPPVSTPTGLFLERAFRFYDVIAALSLGTPPNNNSQPIATPLPSPPNCEFHAASSPLSAVDTLLGLSTNLWPIIHRLSHLLSFKYSLEAAIAAGETSKATVLRTELENTSQAIEIALTEWKPHVAPISLINDDQSDISVVDTRMQSILNNAESYRHSAFVYLYRTIRSRPRSHSCVQKHAHLSLLACSNVVKLAEQCQNGPMSALLWPLFVAACEAVTEEDRALALEAFGGTERRQGMNNILRAWEVVQEVWSRADLTNADINWRDICEEMGFNIVFGLTKDHR